MTRRLLLTLLGLLVAEEAAARAQLQITAVPSAGPCESISQGGFSWVRCPPTSLHIRCDRGHEWDAHEGDYVGLKLDDNPTEFCWKCLTQMLEQNLGILEREP